MTRAAMAALIIPSVWVSPKFQPTTVGCPRNAPRTCCLAFASYGMTPGKSLDLEEEIPSGHVIASLYGHLGNPARRRRCDHGLHLHR
mmetsp:Transcript_85120/g.117503  ORF Transcript_85120/g.117503 Transcript_85120/m.117503 type:complete len:87 (-) Transcript_85120:864-1124(-)